jgi:hypothetical protein
MTVRLTDELLQRVVDALILEHSGDLQGPVGPPGPSIDIADLKARIARLEAAEIGIRFEGGDEPDEPERLIHVPLLGGVIDIPASRLRVRDFDALGNTVGSVLLDVAPLGSPLKIGNRLE